MTPSTFTNGQNLPTGTSTQAAPRRHQGGTRAAKSLIIATTAGLRRVPALLFTQFTVNTRTRQANLTRHHHNFALNSTNFNFHVWDLHFQHTTSSSQRHLSRRYFLFGASTSLGLVTSTQLLPQFTTFTPTVRLTAFSN